MSPLLLMLLLAIGGLALPFVGYWVVDQFYKPKR